MTHCLFCSTATTRWVWYLVPTSKICSLVIITAERYVKIVHPVAYRNHYRRWMTRAGITIPWIFGVCLGLIPKLATSTVTRGRCVKGTWRIELSGDGEPVWLTPHPRDLIQPEGERDVLKAQSVDRTLGAN